MLACAGLCAIFLGFNCLRAVRSTLAPEAAELPAHHSSIYTPFICQLLILGLTAGAVEWCGVPTGSNSGERGRAPLPAHREPKELALERSVPREWKDLRVLVADDNPVNRKILTVLLEKEGHMVVAAGNGQEALEIFETQAFDVILMDIEMPQMNGFEAAAKIRRREIGTGRHIPIVAVSAHAVSGVKEQCLTAGMDRYVSLPLRKEALFAAMADSLKGGLRRRSRRVPPRDMEGC
jgi:CheY-like chemotaxis protein